MKVSAVVLVFLASLAPTCGFNSYLNQMGGGAATAVKPSTFAPSGKPKAAAPNSGTGGYLDKIAGGSKAVSPPPRAPPVPSAPPAAAAPRPVAAAAAGNTAPSVGDYLSSLKGQAAPSGGGVPGYLDALKSSAASAPTGGGVPGYLDALKSSASASPSGKGFTGYLDAIAPSSGSASKSSGFSPKPAFVPSGGGGSNDVLNAIGSMNSNMNKNQQTTISILKEISAGVKGLVSKAEAKMNGVQPWQ
jgi:hypothetical protein